MRNVRVKPVIATLILASALVTLGCKAPLHGADMAKPVTRQAEPDIKPERRPLDIVPQKKGETKKEEPVPLKPILIKPKREPPTLDLAPLPRERPVKPAPELK